MAVAIYTSLLTLDEAPSGTVTVYDAGTTTPRAVFTDTGLSVAATNPIPLDSAGRHEQGMVYTAATAYKVVVKSWAGVTVFTRDDIDPGVPLGTGALAIENGGTGATTAEAALANLGAATAAELADLSEDVASVVGALGSSEKTHIATGTTAQRPAVPMEGDIRRNTTTSKYEGHDGTDWRNFFTTADAATKTDMETASSAAVVVTPSVLKNHPGVAKAWGMVTVTGGIPALTTGYNITSITDNDVGDYTVNLSVPFSSANYAVVATPINASTTNSIFSIEATTFAAGSFKIRAWRASSTNNTQLGGQDFSFSVSCFGDQ